MFAAGKQLMTSAPPNNTKSLLHFNGSSGSTTITDECGVTWTNSGSIPLSTAESKFGGSSLNVPATANAFLYSNDPVFNKVGKVPFTAECWFKPSPIYYNTILNTSISTAVRPVQPVLIISYPQYTWGTIEVHIGNAALDGWVVAANYGSSVADGAWHHIAVVGDGTNITVYVDGASICSVAHPNWSFGVDIQGFGTSAFSSYGSPYIDEFRYSNIARYTGNFTPPTAEFSATG